MVVTQTESGKKYELVPPDGGWGYVICVAVTVNFIATCSFVPSFGIIFNEFFKQLGMGTTDISLLAGLGALSIAVAAFLAGPLLKTMSTRKLALLASVSYNVGIIGTVFVNTQAQLILCQVCQNFGAGLLFNITFTALNDYFTEKRFICISVMNTVVAAAAMVAPMVVGWTTSRFGFKGTLWMMSALSALTFVGSALLQPVAWHMKRVEVKDDGPEMKLLLEKSNNETHDKAIKIPVIKLSDPENAHDFLAGEKIDHFEKDSNNLKRKGKEVINIIKTYLDWPLIKDFLLTFTCYSIPICMFTDDTYTVFLPQYLYARHWSNESVVWAFSLLAFGDIATRILLIFSDSGFKKLGSHLLYVIGVVVSIITKFALQWVTDYTASLVIITAMGISRCTIVVLFPLVISDSVRPEVFPSAMGISMLFLGLFSIVMGPITGAIRDVTGDYATMFYILISFLIAAAVALTAEVVVKRRKQTEPGTNARADSNEYKNKG